jgi:Ca2+-binding EF-hand superfamily protein
LIEEIMEEIDEDGDGNITYKEFYRCMSMQTARKSIRDNCTSNLG